LKQKEICEQTRREYMRKARAFEDWCHKHSQRRAFDVDPETGEKVFKPAVLPGIPSIGQTGFTSEHVIRGDFRQEIDYPVQIDRFKVSPYVVGRLTSYSESVDGGYQLPNDDIGSVAATAPTRSVGEPVPVKRSAAYDAEDLEIPSFLRRK